ncbi:MAG TPA: phosphoglycerate kinase [Methanomassiliicoccales archaeon]|nr:phosphoglycerate kinase [Methanomassiliicoccales archaeon]
MKDHFTIDDLDIKGKTVIYRVDINCPLKKDTLELANDNRIQEILPTLRELLKRRAKVVIVAHQSRPGEWDYISLERHAKRTSELLGVEVVYVDDLYGEKAKKVIQRMMPGEAVMLKNVRDEKGEMDKASMEEHSQAPLVKELSALADLYVSDAFGAAHRSQCSLVGFQAVLPSAAGRLMEKELTALGRVIDSPSHPCVFVLGGSKFTDAIKVVDRVLRENIADKVLMVGLAGNAFLKAKGVSLGEKSEHILMEEFTAENLNAAKGLLDRYGDRIETPVDVALDDGGMRKDVPIGALPSELPICDIGKETAARFSEIVSKACTVFISGPAGVIEREEFSYGTKALMEATVSSDAFSVIGGGHTVSAAQRYHCCDRFSYVSTGGGALENYIMGKPLPVVEALKAAYRREKGK